MTRELYDAKFYAQQVDDSLAAARIYIAHLWKYLQPTSVLDLGCGRGTWLLACRELGSTQLHGIDGPWNSQANMIDPAIEFHSMDLNRPGYLRKVDLAISLEVAEHLEPVSAASFVRALTEASDVVLFGAACPEQGGVGHLNEVYPSYWAGHFMENGFAPFDLFRPTFWGDDRIAFWYRQNTFLYVKHGTLLHQRLPSPVSPLFMDCVHPVLYERTIEDLRRRRTFKGSLKSLIRSLKRRRR